VSVEPADPYAVLDVAPDATAEEIHAAYRRAARRAHPDTGEGSGAQMALVNLAWARLGDPTARAAYDRARQQAPPADLAAHAGPGATFGEDPTEVGGGPSRRLLAVLVVVLAALVVVAILLALLIGFTQGPVA
jgi:curved DNA-binding protein CbpA